MERTCGSVGFLQGELAYEFRETGRFSVLIRGRRYDPEAGRPPRLDAPEIVMATYPSTNPMTLPSGSRNKAMVTISISVRGCTVVAPRDAALASAALMSGTPT
jgi:hypothetical protein